MSRTIVDVQNISKKYRIGAIAGGYKTFRETIISGITFPLQNFRNLRGLTRFGEDDEANTIWALKDVNFSVQEGEALGIIGKNGAGKTTLLKILARITEPTGGHGRVYGRIASLLEVGTGFHPELTGRENVYFNGAVLGMRKREIERKFSDIVEFSEVGPFIDTPLKRFSTGMQMRLAFAVAAFLEPEILLIDEVLAVGDIAFQQKCLGKMGEVAKGGRTVLFVSHNMGAIRQLTSRCLLVDKGKIVYDGDTRQCVTKYLGMDDETGESKSVFSDHVPSDKKPIVIKRVALKTAEGVGRSEFAVFEPWYLEVGLEAIADNTRFHMCLQITDERGIHVYDCWARDYVHEDFYSGRSSRVTIHLPELKLYPGRYSVNVGIDCGSPTHIVYDEVISAISFTVFQTGQTIDVHQLKSGCGIVFEKPMWEHEKQ